MFLLLGLSPPGEQSANQVKNWQSFAEECDIFLSNFLNIEFLFACRDASQPEIIEDLEDRFDTYCIKFSEWVKFSEWNYFFLDLFLPQG